MRPNPAFVRLLLVLAAFGLCANPATADLLYDVDFGTPPHTVGLPPVLGTGPAPRMTPTRIPFGDPTVVAQLGVLTDQPCQFGNGTTNYDQLEFGVAPAAGGFPEAYDFYRVELVVLIEELAGPITDIFKIFLDGPSVNFVRFVPDGNITVYPGGGTIGTFVMGVPLHIRMEIDLLSDEWSVWIDGGHAHTGPANADYLRTIRMNLNGEHEDDAVAIDNFRVYGGDPASVFDLDPPVGETLLAPYPNPSSDGTWIRWQAPADVAARIEVLSVGGRLLWSSRHTPGSAATAAIRWDGRDAAGRPVPAGTYVVRVLVGQRSLGSRRIVLQR